MKYYRTAFIISVLMFSSSCAQQFQREIDDQGKAITVLQQKTQELDRSLRRLQSDYHNELDRVSVELQSMKATVDESSHRTDKAVGEINSRLNTLIGSGKEAQDQSESTASEGTAADSIPVRESPQPPHQKPVDEKEMYHQAYSLFTNGELDKSRKMFQEFLKVYPGSGLMDNALYWIANIYFKEKKFEEAISACDDVIKKFPQGNKTADAYYLQALAFCEIKK